MGSVQLTEQNRTKKDEGDRNEAVCYQWCPKLVFCCISLDDVGDFHSLPLPFNYLVFCPLVGVFQSDVVRLLLVLRSFYFFLLRCALTKRGVLCMHRGCFFAVTWCLEWLGAVSAEERSRLCFATEMKIGKSLPMWIGGTTDTPT